MGDLRKTILSKFGLSVFWSDIWYTNNLNFAADIAKIKLYQEVFYYIFFWGFSFSPFSTLSHINVYLESSSFKLLTGVGYIRAKTKFSKYTQGNLISKVSVLNYYNFIALIFYIYIPTRKKKISKNKKIYRHKLFTNALLSNFK